MSPIKKVTCHVVSAPVERPFTSSRGWLYKTRGSCIVEIETADGITGWGECYGPSAVAKAYIETQFAPRIIGRDAFDVEVIWEDLYNRIKDYGPRGMVTSAMSGIDIALWDIIGKAKTCTCRRTRSGRRSTSPPSSAATPSCSRPAPTARR